MKRFSFITIPREFFEGDLWLEPRSFSRVEAWIDCYQMASWKSEVVAVGSRRVSLKRGEFVASVRDLAERWGWSKSKVERWLRDETGSGVFSRQRSGHFGTVYLITSYEDAAPATVEPGTVNGTNVGQSRGQSTSQVKYPTPVTATEERKESKNKTDSSDAPASEPSGSLTRLPKSTADRAYQVWGQRMGAISYPRLRKTLLGCVDAGIPHEQLPDAVDAYADWLEGLSDRDRQFNTPSPERFGAEVQRWARLGQQPYVTTDGVTERGRLLTRGVA